MNLDDLTSFCEFRDCEIHLGDPDAGFVQIDGSGLKSRSYTYGRFSMLHEVAHLASPAEVLERATIFTIRQGDKERTLGRDEFSKELERFLRLVGA